MNEQNVPVVVAKVSGSSVIKMILKEKGIDTPANEIVALAKLAGKDVSVMLINNVKHKIRHEKEERKKQRKTREKTPVPTGGVVQPVQDEFERMLAVKAFAATVGGYDSLTQTLEKLRKLG